MDSTTASAMLSQVETWALLDSGPEDSMVVLPDLASSVETLEVLGLVLSMEVLALESEAEALDLVSSVEVLALESEVGALDLVSSVEALVLDSEAVTLDLVSLVEVLVLDSEVETPDLVSLVEVPALDLEVEALDLVSAVEVPALDSVSVQDLVAEAPDLVSSAEALLDQVSLGAMLVADSLPMLVLLLVEVLVAEKVLLLSSKLNCQLSLSQPQSSEISS